MNFITENIKPILISFATIIGLYLFNRLVQWSKKETPKHDTTQTLNPTQTPIQNREITQQPVTADLTPSNEAEQNLYNLINECYNFNSSNCISALGTIHENYIKQTGSQKIEDQKTANFLAQLLIKLLEDIGQVESGLLVSTPQNGKKREIQYYILNSILRDLIRRNIIKDPSILNAIAACLLITYNNTIDTCYCPIINMLEMITSKSNHAINHDNLNNILILANNIFKEKEEIVIGIKDKTYNLMYNCSFKYPNWVQQLNDDQRSQLKAIGDTNQEKAKTENK